jgi:hypothetical protein
MKIVLLSNPQEGCWCLEQCPLKQQEVFASQPEKSELNMLNSQLTYNLEVIKTQMRAVGQCSEFHSKCAQRKIIAEKTGAIPNTETLSSGK